MMLEVEAKLLFEHGALSAAMIAPVPMGKGWHLYLVKKQGETEAINRQRGGERVFSSIEAAANTAQAIGFKSVEIRL